MNAKQKHDLASVLRLTPKQISTGLALFYVCYVLFDLPANLIMTRLSPRGMESLCRRSLVRNTDWSV